MSRKKSERLYIDPLPATKVFENVKLIRVANSRVTFARVPARPFHRAQIYVLATSPLSIYEATIVSQQAYAKLIGITFREFAARRDAWREAEFKASEKGEIDKLRMQAGAYGYKLVHESVPVHGETA